MSFAGQALMIIAVGMWFERSILGIALFVALQQAVLFVLAPSFLPSICLVRSA